MPVTFEKETVNCSIQAQIHSNAYGRPWRSSSAGVDILADRLPISTSCLRFQVARLEY